MTKIISKMLSLLKILLFLGAFALIFVGILLTYKRLEKPITDAIPVLIPFVLSLIMIIINLIVNKAKMSDNLIFNFTACVLFASIIIIGYRAKFDTNMLLYYKYQINYNPNYLADNLSTIKVMLYCLTCANVFFLLKTLFITKEEPKKTLDNEETISKFTPYIEQTKNNESVKNIETNVNNVEEL